jgi:O-antigen/teichoic acid export membrane protein
LLLISSEAVFSLGTEVNFSSFLIVALAVFALYAVKIILLKILGFILDKQQAMNEYIFTVFLVNQVIAIGLIPVNIFMAYGSPSLAIMSIYTGIILLVIAFIVKVGKGTLGALAGGEITLFYLLLYLCTFEILPLLLGYKLIEKLI